MSEEKKSEVTEEIKEEAHELSPAELEKVNGGLLMDYFSGSTQMDCLKDASATAIYGAQGAN